MKIELLFEKLFPHNHTLWIKLLTVTGLIDKFDPTESDPSKLLDQLNQLLQNNWLRKAGTERWDVSDNTLSDTDRTNILDTFTQMNLYTAVQPNTQIYDCAFLLGALETRVRSRFQHLVDLWKQGVKFKRVYVLAGYRELLTDREPIAEQMRKDGIDLNETNMTQYVVNQMLPEGFPEIIYVNAPIEGNAPRANTGNTFAKWKEDYGTEKNILVISNQPFVSYQAAMGCKVLSDNYKLPVLQLHAHHYKIGDREIDTVGHEGSANTLSVGLDSLAREIYAKLPWLKQLAQQPAKPILHSYSGSVENIYVGSTLDFGTLQLASNADSSDTIVNGGGLQHK